MLSDLLSSCFFTFWLNRPIYHKLPPDLYKLLPRKIEYIHTISVIQLHCRSKTLAPQDLYTVWVVTWIVFIEHCSIPYAWMIDPHTFFTFFPNLVNNYFGKWSQSASSQCVLVFRNKHSFDYDFPSSTWTESYFDIFVQKWIFESLFVKYKIFVWIFDTNYWKKKTVVNYKSHAHCESCNSIHHHHLVWNQRYVFTISHSMNGCSLTIDQRIDFCVICIICQKNIFDFVIRSTTITYTTCSQISLLNRCIVDIDYIYESLCRNLIAVCVSYFASLVFFNIISSKSRALLRCGSNNRAHGYNCCRAQYCIFHRRNWRKNCLNHSNATGITQSTNKRDERNADIIHEFAVLWGFALEWCWAVRCGMA